ncbi:hypothetical protein XENOCAPTIV_007456 [Xenoophorus captivus]|uniref:Uncharacterized protein n=1 Tax=Xenoophorus captivus TaxID=1517983 RepID=A0ABV0RTT7_9TELE
MTVPLRRLAGLWPWLLMAALQVVLGQPSLESERSGLRAVIKVTLVKEPTVEPIVLKGQFVGGSAGKAQGKLMQVTGETLTTDMRYCKILSLLTHQSPPACPSPLSPRRPLPWPSAQSFGNEGWEGGVGAEGQHQSTASSERELG